MASNCGLVFPRGGGGGASVNDGINPDDFSLHYISVDQVIRMVSQFGKGAQMAKFDFEAAYRNIAIHPADRYLFNHTKCRQNYPRQILNVLECHLICLQLKLKTK